MQELRPLEQKSSLSGSNETSRSISSIDSTASCSSRSSSASSSNNHTSLLAQDSAADEQWENLDVDAIAANAAAATSREKESFVSAQPSAAAEAVRAATAAAHKLRTALVLAEATRAGGGSSSGKVSTMYSIQSNHRFFDCFTSYNFDMVQILGAFLIFV
jgi:hypothetical protein